MVKAWHAASLHVRATDINKAKPMTGAQADWSASRLERKRLACDEREARNFLISETATGTVALQSVRSQLRLVLVMLQVQLNDVEDRALWIAQHGETTHVRNVRGRNVLPASD